MKSCAASRFCAPLGTWALLLGVACSGAPRPTDAAFPTPAPLRPWNGEMTGSALASPGRRPRFQWTAVAGATGYELQVDDSCPATGFSSCAFSSPEIAALDVAAPSYTPGQDLAVSLTQPVGRRYFWRVRACHAAGCSPWSPVRYVDVGRMAQDLNGDGHADVAVGTSAGPARPGRLFLYLGRAAPLPAGPDLTITGVTGDGFGYVAEPAGDVNADGYPDLVVGAFTSSEGGPSAGRAYLFLGGRTVKTTPELALTGSPGEFFGVAVAGIGDADGDGYADFAVGAIGVGPGHVYVYRGGATLHDTADLQLAGEADGDGFGYPLQGLQDVNGDGYADFAVGAYSNGAAGTDAGRAYVFTGGPTLHARPDLTLTGEAAGDFFGDGLGGGGDVDGDGYADIAVGADHNDAGGTDAGRVYLYRGGATVDGVADFTVDGPAAGAHFGWLALADLNGDGFDDLLVGSAVVAGDRLFAFLGGAALAATPDLAMAGSDRVVSMAPAGDIDGDGFADLVVGTATSDPPANQFGRVYVYSGARLLGGTPSSTLTGPSPGENYGICVSAAEPVTICAASPS